MRLIQYDERYTSYVELLVLVPLALELLQGIVVVDLLPTTTTKDEGSSIISALCSVGLSPGIELDWQPIARRP